MQRFEVTAAESEALIDRLAEIKELRTAPRAERAWLVAHGEMRRYERGEIVVRKAEVANDLVIMLKGRIVVYFDHGTGRRHMIETRAGTMSGVLPYSRLGHPPGDVMVEEDIEMIAISRDLLQEMIRECPTITTVLVHLMVDRARSSAATDWQDEKMVALGRLSAGLAHELNNPASAATRMSKLLTVALGDVGDAARAFGALDLTTEQHALVEALIRRGRDRGPDNALSPLERADQEEAMAEWLTSHGADMHLATPLAESGVDLATLSELATTLPGGAVSCALSWFAAEGAARSLARDVERATTRIYDLVSSVKRFTFMDRAGGPMPTDVAQGLTDTVTVMASKAREKGVVVKLDLAPALPLVLASVAELNQVWANLLDNALDAVDASGEVTVCAATDGEAVLVRVIDNGPGIPANILGHIFDPFFTTKPVGQGVGLGLDIALRIVRVHDGKMDVESVPGRTEFRVQLPAVLESGG